MSICTGVLTMCDVKRPRKRWKVAVALTTVMALGLACFGLFCFAWARHIDR